MHDCEMNLEFTRDTYKLNEEDLPILICEYCKKCFILADVVYGKFTYTEHIEVHKGENGWLK